MGYLVTASGLGGLVGIEYVLRIYARHAYWFLGAGGLFLGAAAYFNLYRYPTRTNRILMGVNVLAVLSLVYTYWI